MEHMKHKTIRTVAKRISLDSVKLDAALQARNALREATVQEYAEAMQAGAEFPPIVVARIGNDEHYTVLDGWHRVTAMRALGVTEAEAEVKLMGSLKEATWFAAGLNATHGLRRTNADKARAVHLALSAQPDASFEALAEHCGVSRQMVSNYWNATREAIESNVTPEEIAAAVQQSDEAEAPTVEAAMQEAKGRIHGVVNQARAVAAAVEVLIEDGSGAFINAQSVLSDLMNVESALLNSAPHKVCPLCAGNGCETCRMRGWVSKKQWQLIPAELRG